MKTKTAVDILRANPENIVWNTKEEQVIVKAMEEYRSQLTESKELPGDDEINEYAKIKCDKFYGKGNQDDFSDSILFYNFGMQQMRSLASPLLASKDARIRELEEEKKRLQFIIDNGLGERDLTNDL